MEQPEASYKHRFKNWIATWATTFGLSVTVLWFVSYILLYYIYTADNNIDGFIKEFYSKPLNEQGDFLAGFFAPLAFLWLIIGYFMQSYEISLQRQEIKAQSEEMKHQRKEMETQAQAMEANARSAALNVFLIQSKDIFKEMEVAAQAIYNMLVERVPHQSIIERSEGLSPLAKANLIINFIYQSYDDGKSLEKIFAVLRDDIAANNKSNYVTVYCYNYYTLLKSAYKADEKGELVFYYHKSSAGRLNATLINMCNNNKLTFPYQIEQILGDELYKALQTEHDDANFVEYI